MEEIKQYGVIPNLKIPEEVDIINTYKSSRIPIKSFNVLKKRKWFPIEYESLIEISYLVGKIMGDGHLEKNYIASFFGEETDLFALKELIVNTFAIEEDKFLIGSKKAYGTSYFLKINDALFGRLLNLFGAPKGNKTKTEFQVPKWVWKRKIFKKRFLQAILEDELAVIKIISTGYQNSPNFKMHKRDYLGDNLFCFIEEIKILVENFGIECSNIIGPQYISKKEYPHSMECYFWIQRNRKNIIKFKEKVGFRFNKHKLNSLNDVYSKLIIAEKKGIIFKSLSPNFSNNFS